MSGYSVSPADLDGPVNVIGRASYEITTRIQGTLSNQANLAASDLGSAAVASQYQSAISAAVETLGSVAAWLDDCASDLAAAAGGYVEVDTQVERSMTGTPVGNAKYTYGPLGAAIPLPSVAKGVPTEYAVAPNNQDSFDLTTYHIGHNEAASPLAPCLPAKDAPGR